MKKHPLIIAAGIFFLAFILSRVDPQPTTTPAKEVSAEPEVKPNTNGRISLAYKGEILARERLRASLRDPDSMELRGEYMASVEGNPVMCGEVNSRNGFGGLTGFQRFIAPPVSTIPVVLEGENLDAREFDELWRKVCARRM